MGVWGSGRGSIFNSRHSCRRLPLYISFVGVEMVWLVELVVFSGGFGGGVCGCGDGAQGVGVWRRHFFFDDIFLNLPLLNCLSCCICLRLVVGEVVWRIVGELVGWLTSCWVG